MGHTQSIYGCSGNLLAFSVPSGAKTVGTCCSIDKMEQWRFLATYSVKIKRQLSARLEGVQWRIANGAPYYLLKLERRLQQELDQTLDCIALLWFQTAREDQIRDGDRNTTYYHTATIIRRRFNRVTAIKDNDGVWCTDSGRIHQIIVAHFTALFSMETHAGVDLVSSIVNFPQLSPTAAQGLHQPFTRDDIVQALKAMQPFKAPGPDGFHAYFFQQYWHLVADDVCNVVLQVLRGNPMPSGLNDTFITLILKVSNPKTVSQFRPIGLCNVVYKLITKFLVNRLKKALLELISPIQSSFVHRRQITDNVIAMQEVLHSPTKNRC